MSRELLLQLAAIVARWDADLAPEREVQQCGVREAAPLGDACQIVVRRFE